MAAKQDFQYSYACLLDLYGRSSKSLQMDKEKMEKYLKLALGSKDLSTRRRAKTFQADLYMHGLWGRKRDPQKALKILREAAEEDCPNANHTIGFMTGSGQIGKRDPVLASTYFIKAAKTRHPKSVSFLGGLYLRGDGISRDIKKGLKLTKLAANLGNASAMIRLSDLYDKGQHIPKDHKKALAWILKSTNAGELKAYHMAGLYYQEGRAGLKPDIKKAIHYYELAAISNSAGGGYSSFKPSIEKLASIHMGHQGGERNPKKALPFLFRSDHPQAQYDLAILYQNNEFLEKDLVQALNLFKKAASRGHKKAIQEVVKAYEIGLGIKKNQLMADKWKRKLK